jgi:hypothetical protein
MGVQRWRVVILLLLSTLFGCHLPPERKQKPFYPAANTADYFRRTIFWRVGLDDVGDTVYLTVQALEEVMEPLNDFRTYNGETFTIKATGATDENLLSIAIHIEILF